MTPTTRKWPLLALSASYGVSSFGNFLNLIAVNLYVLAIGGSVLQAGAMMAARLATAFAAGLIAGRLATRLPRRILMIFCDLLQAAAMLLLLVVPAAVQPAALWVAALLLGAGNTVFTVALRASIPDLAGFAARDRGNGLVISAKALGMVLGFAAAGPLIGEFGFAAAFGVNAATFLVSAAALLLLPLPFRPAVKSAPAGRESPTGPRLGLRGLLLTTSAVTSLVALRGIEGWGSGSHNVALPVLAQSIQPDNPAAVLSYFWTAWAIGNLSMYWLVGPALRRASRQYDDRVYAAAAGMASIAFIAVFAEFPGAVMAAVALVAGFADGLAELTYAGSLQAAPESERAAVFGMLAAVETAGLAGGMFCSALLLDRSAPLPVVAFFHGTVIVTMIAYLLRRNHRSGRNQPVAESHHETTGARR